MGQIPNKTYTAPDGSLYRVEADGSITKIKGVRVQSNEPPSKYNITPDGKIYRVESDGSVTYLGNAEDRQDSRIFAPTTDFKKSNHKWWILVAIAVIAAISVIIISIISILDRDSMEYENILENYENIETQNYESNDEDVSYDSWNYHEQLETPEEAAYEPITFPDTRNYVCSDDYGFYEMDFGSNGIVSIYRTVYEEDSYNSYLVDNGSYELINGQISFNNFSSWPNETVYIYEDDSFELNMFSFQRGNL